MRSDKKKTVDKLAAILIKNPIQTQEELASQLGVDHSTISRAMPFVQEITQKDSRIQALTEDDYQIVRLTQAETKNRLEDEEKKSKINARDLTYIGDVAARRYSLLVGNATDEQGGLNINIVNFGDNTTSSI